MSVIRVAEIFVDTNILLYAISTSEAESGKTSVAQSVLQNRDWTWSTQIAGEFIRASTSSRKSQPLSLGEARKFIQAWSGFPMVPVDEAIVLDAINISERFQISYFDAQVVAAAKRQRCRQIFTEDLNHQQDYGGVSAFNPFL